MKKNIIYSNKYNQVEAIIEDIKNDEEFKDYTEEELFQYAYDSLSNWFNDEELNINKLLDNDIIAIADIGRWNGRVKGYKELSNDLTEILYCDNDNAEEIELYCNAYNVCKEIIDHDGTTYITFRKWKNNISDIQKENFLNKLYCGNVTKKDISRYTKSIKPDIVEVYGF